MLFMPLPPRWFMNQLGNLALKEKVTEATLSSLSISASLSDYPEIQAENHTLTA